MHWCNLKERKLNQVTNFHCIQRVLEAEFKIKSKNLEHKKKFLINSEILVVIAIDNFYLKRPMDESREVGLNPVKNLVDGKQLLDLLLKIIPKKI